MEAPGAILKNGRCHFCVWAPPAENVAVHLLSPEDRLIPMQRDARGYHTVAVENVQPGTRYLFRLNADTERPDPASRFQPDGVHGASQVVSPEFAWTDKDWFGIPLEAYIFYELHVGTFTPEGTFDAVIEYLPYLKNLGVTALEIMPVAQFPGTRNWGYDGTGIYAPQNSYGGPDGLKRLVNACHAHGLAVVLDVVYNHLGPEGNYLNDFGPYFTDRYQTPWGAALNFDGEYSDPVRQYFLENALYWITEFHIDALRLDATHAMLDFSAYTFLEQLTASIHERAEKLNRRVYLIAENDRSDNRLLLSPELGGYGMDAQWSDDLHHVLHTLITHENFGYYADFGQFRQLVSAVRYGFVYSGLYSVFRERTHGTFGADLPGYRFVICSQNHDQVGNRMNGDRLSHLGSFEEVKLAAGVVLLSPYLPLLFMGEEYAETAPFLFFTSFEDPQLGPLVTEGRRNEFKGHQWEGEAPDPQDVATFQKSKLNHHLRTQGHHQRLLNFYTELIRLRKTIPALRTLDKQRMEVFGYEREMVLFLHRWYENSEIVAVFNFDSTPRTLTLPFPFGRWYPVLNSTDKEWAGDSESAEIHIPVWAENESAQLTLAPKSFVLFERE